MSAQLRAHAGRLIERHEGRRAVAYLDSTGHPTVGIGFNLDRRGAAEVLARIGLDLVAVRAGQALTEEQINELFRGDLEQAVIDARAALHGFDALPLEVRVALTDMAFNLGLPRLLGFRSMLRHLERGDRPGAAAAALDSRWARQVGRRAVTDAGLIGGMVGLEDLT